MNKKIFASLAFFVVANFSFTTTPQTGEFSCTLTTKKVEAGYALFERRKAELEKEKQRRELERKNSKRKQDRDKIDAEITKIQKELDELEKAEAKNQGANSKPKFSGLG